MGQSLGAQMGGRSTVLLHRGRTAPFMQLQTQSAPAGKVSSSAEPRTRPAEKISLIRFIFAHFFVCMLGLARARVSTAFFQIHDPTPEPLSRRARRHFGRSCCWCVLVGSLRIELVFRLSCRVVHHVPNWCFTEMGFQNSENVMNIIRLASLSLGFAFVSGCAFSSVDRVDINAYTAGITTSQSFNISPDDATNTTKSTLEAIGYEIQSVTPELGLVRTRGRPVLVPDVCDCGKWNGRTIAGTGMSVIKFTTEPSGAEETSFRLEHSRTTKFTGKNFFGDTTREETYQCASRGIAEAQFWETLRRIVAKRAKPSSAPRLV